MCDQLLVGVVLLRVAFVLTNSASSGSFDAVWDSVCDSV